MALSLLYVVMAMVAVFASYMYIKVHLQGTTRCSDTTHGATAAKMSNGTHHGKDAAGGAAATTAAAQGEAVDNKPILVLYGSQTGTAEMFAKTLLREGTKLGLPMRISDVEDYDTYNLEYERVVLLVCATYGEGEPTDSMKSFHEWLMDDARTLGEELAAVKYAVFGLGDRQYKYFCEEGIVVDRRFAELGAQRIYGAACGDAGGGRLEEHFDEWCRDLWPAVSRATGLALRAYTEEPVEAECRMKVWDEEEAPLPFPKTASVLEPTQRLPVWVSVVRNEELLKQPPAAAKAATATSARSTRAIDLNIADTIISYQAGDHLGVLPCNTDAVVDDYLAILAVSDAEARSVFSLQNKKTLKNVFPARVSVRTAMKWYVDLQGPPKKSTLRAFAHYCTDAAQKAELLRLLRVDAAAQQEYTALCAELRTVYGFLRRFDSARVPVAFFLELMPRISPRYYSVSSDPLASPGTLGVTVALVEGGLCTSMLHDLRPGGKVPVFVRKSTFHLPLRDKERPIIMVGPGTGVAPFIGFLHRRRAWQSKGAKLGTALLFFGCRRHDEDYIYEDTFAAAVRDGVLSRLYVAHSREGAQKVYVQHLIRDAAREVWDVLHTQRGNLYICGDAKRMARDVEAQLLRIAQEHGNMSADDAQAYLKRLEDEERYLKDVWTSTL